MTKFGRVRIEDVAREAQVSPATVDRVLNGRAGVRPVTCERVWSAVARLNGAVVPANTQRSHDQALELDFIMAQGAGPSIEENLRQATENIGGNATIRWHEVKRFNPEALATKIRQVYQAGSDGIAVQTLEHPVVHAAVNEATSSGVEVIALLSDLTSSLRRCYVGIDNRAAGRTAGYLIGRLTCGREGKVAVIAGSDLYRSHEEREMGFRRLCREEFPNLEILDLVIGNDEPEDNFRSMSNLLSANSDLIGVYNVGSGNRGIVRAVKECGRADTIVFIAHHLTSVSRQYLLDGVVDAVLNQDMPRLVEKVVSIFSQDEYSRSRGSEFLPFEIIVRENTPN
ncbi:MAG: LacI family DNA-binding transcriptional regulator [Alphaproteobacteria bacterium]|nr:LacI family DNA-binding transcriptional regulator [Alphaproteobacteria bacterium]